MVKIQIYSGRQVGGRREGGKRLKMRGGRLKIQMNSAAIDQYSQALPITVIFFFLLYFLVFYNILDNKYVDMF